MDNNSDSNDWDSCSSESKLNNQRDFCQSEAEEVEHSNTFQVTMLISASVKTHTASSSSGGALLLQHNHVVFLLTLISCSEITPGMKSKWSQIKQTPSSVWVRRFCSSDSGNLLASVGRWIVRFRSLQTFIFGPRFAESQRQLARRGRGGGGAARNKQGRGKSSVILKCYFL